MPLRFTPLEYLLYRLNLLPTPLFDLPLAPGLAKVLHCACELGLFDLLSSQGFSLSVLAEKLTCHPQSLQLLLQVLVSAGYLRYQRGKYRNTGISQRWLTSCSSYNIAPYILHGPDIVAIWDHLPSVIRTNQPTMSMPYTAETCTQEAQQLLARHYAGLAALSLALGDEIVRHIHVPAGATRLLDVGGSHAGYSALFCCRYPSLQATVIDIQPGIEAGKITAERLQLQGRLYFISANIVHDDFPAQLPLFDVALYFHIAHLLPPEVNRAVLLKVTRTLRPGGMLVFVDQITDQAHHSYLSSLLVQLMALTMATVGGTCYPFVTVRTWLEDAGMGQVRRHRLLIPGVTLITAIKERYGSAGF